jgi:hypothetical protein
VDGRRATRLPGAAIKLFTGLLFGVLVVLAAFSGAVPAAAKGADALRVTRSVAPAPAPAVAPRGSVARPAPSRSAASTTAAPQQLNGHVASAAGPAAPVDTAPHPATGGVALLPDRRGPPALVALAVVTPTTSSVPPGRTPAVSRSRAPPVSA